MKRLVVLDDGDTFGSLTEDITIMTLTDEIYEECDGDIKHLDDKDIFSQVRPIDLIREEEDA